MVNKLIHQSNIRVLEPIPDKIKTIAKAKRVLTNAVYVI